MAGGESKRTIFYCEVLFLSVLMHQPLFVSETEMKSARVLSVLTDVHRWIFLLCLRDLSKTRVLAKQKPEVSLNHSEDTSMAVTFCVEFMETVFCASEKQF